MGPPSCIPVRSQREESSFNLHEPRTSAETTLCTHVGVPGPSSAMPFLMDGFNLPDAIYDWYEHGYAYKCRFLLACYVFHANLHVIISECNLYSRFEIFVSSCSYVKFKLFFFSTNRIGSLPFLILLRFVCCFRSIYTTSVADGCEPFTRAPKPKAE